MKILLASLLALTPVAAIADEYQEGYSTSRSCFKTEYREEYIPGTADNPGYVQSYHCLLYTSPSPRDQRG